MELLPRDLRQTSTRTRKHPHRRGERRLWAPSSMTNQTRPGRTNPRTTESNFSWTLNSFPGPAKLEHMSDHPLRRLRRGALQAGHSLPGTRTQGLNAQSRTPEHKTDRFVHVSSRGALQAGHSLLGTETQGPNAPTKVPRRNQIVQGKKL